MAQGQQLNMGRPEAIIAGLLYALKGSVNRTKLVKLTYLLDESEYRLHGKTMTGFDYIWDNYGPNAKANGIVACLAGMVDRDLVTMQRLDGSHGPQYNYRVFRGCVPANLPLSSEDWVNIFAIAQNYGRLNSKVVVAKSKETEPMKRALGEDDDLVFNQDSPISEEEMAAVPLYMQVDEAMSDQSEWMTIEDLRSIRG